MLIRRCCKLQPFTKSLILPCCLRRSYSHLPHVISTEGVPIHLNADEIEPQAMAQVKLLAESPLPVDYVSVMPDAHLGKGVTIGTVFASEKYICPNAVGVDIGCGMAAVPIHELYKSNLTDSQKVQIFRRLKERIPTGFAKHNNMLPETKETIEKITEELKPTQFVKDQLLMSHVTHQLGTLGGGNHFLEIVHCDRDNQVWSLLHSGSRNIGNRVAQQYDGIAKRLLQRQGIDTRRLNGIHYMPIDSQEGQDYLRDMEWSQQYAFQNRIAMQQIMLQIIADVTKCEADMSRSVNIHHNYCSCEDCNGRMLYVTRKGATSAAKGKMGIIPGNMGSGSYITRGKDEIQSWNSSSHGAGRQMSRVKAHSSITERIRDRNGRNSVRYTPECERRSTTSIQRFDHGDATAIITD